MKIAITASEKLIDSQVETRFGRAPFFMIYDLEKNNYEFLENSQSLNTPSGAGIQAAQNVIPAGVQAVITGHCGPNAFRALSAAEIKIYVNVKTTIQQAIDDFQQGKLTPIDQPDVEGHWV